MPQICQICRRNLGNNHLLSEALSDTVPLFFVPVLQERICELEGCIQPE